MEKRDIKYGLITFVALGILFLANVNRAAATTYTWKATSASNWNNSNNWNPSGVPNATSDDVIFDNTSTNDCSIDVNVSIKSITVNSTYTGKITQQNGFTITVASSSTIGGGTFVGGNSDIKFSGPLTISGSATFKNTSGTLYLQDDFTYSSTSSLADNAGNSPCLSGTVSFYRPGEVGAYPQDILVNSSFGDNLFNMKFQGASASQYSITSSGSALTVKGDLTIAAEDATSLSISGKSITVKGNTTTTGASSGSFIVINNTINIQGNMSIQNKGSNSSNSYSGGAGTIIFNGSGAQSFASSVSQNQGVMPGITIDKSAGTLDLAGSISVSGHWNCANGANSVTLNSSNRSRIIIKVKAVTYGPLIITSKDASGNYMSFDKLIIDDVTDAEATLGSQLIVLDSLYITSGSKLSTSSSNYDIKVGGDWICSGGFSANSGTVTFNGSSQKIYMASGNSFNNLTINQSSSTSNVTLTSPVTIGVDWVTGSALTLTKGIVKTSAANTLFFAIYATASAGSTSSFVEGPITRTGNTAFTFPLGSSSGTVYSYRPLSISAPSSYYSYTAEYAKSNPQTAIGSGLTSPILKVTNFEYWKFTPGTGASSVNVTLSWNTSDTPDPTYVQDTPCSLSDLLVCEYNSGTGKWVSDGNSATSGTAASGTVQSSTTIGTAATTSFLTLGSKSSCHSLPITLSSFTAEPIDGTVRLMWTTETEINNDFFEVQRSINGISFNGILTLKSRNGNSIVEEKYSAIDFFALPGPSYYRLAQTDLDKKITYSEVVRVDVTSRVDFTVSPNPYSGNGELVFKFPIVLKDNAELTVSDFFGNEIVRESFLGGSPELNYVKRDFSKKFMPGIYLVTVVIEARKYMYKLMVQ